MIDLAEGVGTPPAVNHERELVSTEHLDDSLAQCWELGNEEDEETR
jgi:hypothetical protein